MWSAVLICSQRTQMDWLVYHTAALHQLFWFSSNSSYFMFVIELLKWIKCFHISVIHMWRLHSGKKPWTTEKTTVQTHWIQRWEGEIGMEQCYWKTHVFLYCFNNDQTLFMTFLNPSIICWIFFPGCLRCRASCLRTRTWRLQCMTLTYLAEMKKWVRRS